jgi:rhamnose utilization protein RhaD (predicted bifunctional aldolase and dehydrogenase)/NAD(P)-dependent dehydrogenase (short-subunit alcohol dehydrogenase family)
VPKVKSLWNDADARAFGGDPLQLRVYTSRLLGRDPSLVLHGGGNTSVKSEVADLFGRREPVLYVKGSGWDLATIEARGFAPVRLPVLQRMAELPLLSDGDMVRAQRAAMTDPNAPTPSVEAILHAIIPFAFVDHTHADAVVTVSNTPGGEAKIRRIYGDRVLVVPYVMPGFILARKVFEMTRDMDWSNLEGIILLNHGVFTYGADARSSYERMIALVNECESYLERETTAERVARKPGRSSPALVPDLDLAIAGIRKQVSLLRGAPMLTRFDIGEESHLFSCLPGIESIASGPLTPDHVIRTKPLPLVLSGDLAESVQRYASDYDAYFRRHAVDGMTRLDPAPRWAVWPSHGIAAFGSNWNDVSIVSDIIQHTRDAILAAESLGGWRPLEEKSLFEVEYWELEQAKLRKTGTRPPLEGKIALVTGAASGIGRACADLLREQGAAVAGLDINPVIEEETRAPEFLGVACDVTDPQALTAAVRRTVRQFGGLDCLITNAGLFTPSMLLDQIDDETWSKSLDLNLSSHMNLLRISIPFLRLGIDPAVVVIGSKNVPAPGPGAAAYSVAKAGLTQLARVAALELARDGIRVNVIHPNAVFDTGVWTPEILEQRARNYRISVEQYVTNNLLGVPVTSKDVAALVLAMLGPAFARTTGAQVPIDGGNERVI